VETVGHAGSPGSPGERLRVTLGGTTRVPPGATALRVRCGIRWAARGTVRWYSWRLDAAPEPGPHRRLRLGVASARPGTWVSPEENECHYLRECRRAGEAGIDLVCLPEVILTFGMPASPEATQAAARPVPGEWLRPFQDVAREFGMGICFSVGERAGEHGEIVYNTAVLIGRDGSYVGKYRKIHLALAEARKGVAAGHELPVFDFHGVRVGMAICMDSTPLETARLLALQGAEVLLMPIMGDFRATPWQLGSSKFHRERWEAVQRAHALDNHLYVVAARNGTEGSAITAPWGEVLAYDDGSQGVIWADVDVDDVRSHPRGSTMRAVIHSMRRPAVYGALTHAVTEAAAHVP
jgi:predicted amidohydrolase